MALKSRFNTQKFKPQIEKLGNYAKKGKDNPNYGKKYSEERVKKASEARLNRDVWNKQKEIINMYNKVLSAPKIAKKFNCSYTLIYAILNKNNIEVKGNKKVWSKQERMDVIDMYVNKDISVNKIAKIFNCAIRPISKILKENNIKIKGTSYFNKGSIPHNKLNLPEKEIIEMYNQNIPGNKIAKQFNCHYETIYRVLNKNNIKRNQSKNIAQKRRWAENPKYKEKMIKGSQERWKNKEYRENTLRNMMKSMKMKPNKPEKIMISLIKENNLPILYTGDYKPGITIGGFCPDFMCNPSKKIIELFGDYWHNLPEVKKRDRRRFSTYKKYGFRTLVIWQHELENPNQVLNKIKGFIK